LVGYALAFGKDGAFLATSTEGFALNSFTEYIAFFFQYAFAATSATIVAGTIAERCKMTAYIFYSLFLTAFVYPIVVHAIWNDEGFLSVNNPFPFRGVGMIDFAGSGVVHTTGGVTAIVAAIILGPRIGRFTDDDGNVLAEPNNFPPHSVSLQVLGTFILWFGWLGFNPGSTLAISTPGLSEVAALCAVNTVLSGAMGCISAIFTDSFLVFVSTGDIEYDLSMAMNGCLGGLVGITASCSVVAPWAAIVIGLVSGLVYRFSSVLLIKLRIDDAVDAIPVHLFNGTWGCLAVGLFAEPTRIKLAYGIDDNHVGWFYSWGRGSSDANLLLCQFVGILFIIGWTAGVMTPFFMVLKVCGALRIDPIEERAGIDYSHHKGSAYHFSGPTKAEMDRVDALHDHGISSKQNIEENRENLSIKQEEQT
jgi:Amt family ammonium transporter